MSLLLPGLAFIGGVIWAATVRGDAADVSADAASTWAVVSLAATCLLAVVSLLVLVSARMGHPTRALLAAIGLALTVGRVHAELAFARTCELAWQPRAGVVDVVVEGASTPGPRCLVEVRPLASGATPEGAGLTPGRFRLELPAEACPLAEGERIGVVASTLHARPAPPRWLESSWSGWREQPPTLRADVWFRRGVDPRVSSGWLAPYWRSVAELRQALLVASRGDAARGLVVASTLGQRSALPEDETTALRGSGLWHLVSVSGLHVAVASMLALALGLRVCGALGLRVQWAIVGAWAFVAAYVALTGASAPAVRAGMMTGWMGLGLALGRPAHGPTTLVMALVTMLAVNPGWIVDPGFQLSAVAMAALVTANRDSGLVAQGWRLTWALAPLCLWWFDEVSLVGVLLNVVAVPVFTLVVLPAGLVGGVLVSWAGGAALDVAAAGARLILDLAAVSAWLPALGRDETARLAVAMLGVRAWWWWRSGARPSIASRRPTTTLVRRAGEAITSAPGVALLAVVLVSWGQPEPSPLPHAALRSRIHAVGDATHRATWFARPGGGTCLDLRRASSLPWARWLSAVGTPRPWVVLGDDPAAVAARARLMGLGDDGRCAVASIAAQRRLAAIGGTLRSCARQGGTSPTFVRFDGVTRRWSCAMASGWRALP